MIEIENRVHTDLLRLMKACRANPEAVAVAQGINPGWIFVDQIDTPQTALVWSRGIEGAFVIGRSLSGTFRATLDRLLHDTLLPRVRAREGLDTFEVSASPGLEDSLDEVLSARHPARWMQRVYRYPSGPWPTPRSLARGVLRPITEADLRHEGKETALLRDQVALRWASPQAFCARGFGFCVWDGGAVVSLCYTGWVTDDTAVVSIETREDHRRQGFAEAAARLMVREVLRRGLGAYWDCEDTNAGSFRMAEKIGFMLEGRYPCFGFEISPAR